MVQASKPPKTTSVNIHLSRRKTTIWSPRSPSFSTTATTTKVVSAHRFSVSSLMVIVSLIFVLKSSFTILPSASAAWTEGNDLWGKRSDGSGLKPVAADVSRITLPKKNDEVVATAAAATNAPHHQMHPIPALHPKNVLMRHLKNRSSDMAQKKWQQADTLWGKRSGQPSEHRLSTVDAEGTPSKLVVEKSVGLGGTNVVAQQGKRAWDDGSTMWGKKRRKKDDLGNSAAWSQADSLWG